ncbi:MAG TPA: hypothetical protein VK195_09885 [Burkholderiaceae bacterium]|nr:hypothetical protein [Burkholderiaceae bacterium]
MNTPYARPLPSPTFLRRPPCGLLPWSPSGALPWLFYSLALAGAAALGGCAAPTPPKPSPPAEAAAPPAAPAVVDQQRRGEFDKALDSWHGATVQELLRKMGKPEAITRRADGSFDYRYSKSTRAGADGRAAFSCTVRYVVDAPGRQVIGHSIEGC